MPSLNAVLNTASAVLIALGWRAIRQGNERSHKRFMIGALVTSSLFLVSYLAYHFQVGSVHYQGTGGMRRLYFVILISHSILAAAIVPLVLATVHAIATGRRQRHRALGRWTMPIWLYVSVTGVIVYLMLYVF